MRVFCWTTKQSLAWPMVMLLVAMSEPAYAMRCDGGLTANGDSPEQVLQKCGVPASRVVELPHRRFNHVIEGAVTVERWIYGPRHGARYHLRFVAGKLVDEDVELAP